MKSLTEHPRWLPSAKGRGLALRIHVTNLPTSTPTNKRLLELEVGDLTDQEREQLMAIQIDCARCGKPCQALRPHKNKAGRLNQKQSSLTVATTCRGAAAGCSNSPKSTREIGRLLVAIWSVRRAYSRLQMPEWRGVPPIIEPDDPVDLIMERM